jgi:hypothetical protein
MLDLTWFNKQNVYFTVNIELLWQLLYATKRYWFEKCINLNNYQILWFAQILKIGQGMTSWECYENKWFYMKYIGKYLSEEILLRFKHKCKFLTSQFYMIYLYSKFWWKN